MQKKMFALLYHEKLSRTFSHMHAKDSKKHNSNKWSKGKVFSESNQHNMLHICPDVIFSFEASQFHSDMVITDIHVDELTLKKEPLPLQLAIFFVSATDVDLLQQTFKIILF